MAKKKKNKEWSTRKITLWFAIFVCLFYSLADCILTFINASTGSAIWFDSTLTTELFDFMKWVVGLGGGLSAINVITDARSKNNEVIDEDEEAQG